MTTGYPLPLASAPPTAQPPRTAARPEWTPANPGSWRYDGRPRSRALIVLALVLSAGVHVGLLLGFGRARPKAAAAPERPLLALAVAIPDLKDLEEPEPVPTDDAGRTTDLTVVVPMQADLPQLPQPSDFVQQIDFSSLMEKPDFSQMTVLSIPENIRRGGKIAESIGSIFNLADLDRVPEAVLQPSPMYPISMKREGVTATVVVEFIVDTQGRAINAFILETTHRGFDEAAITGVQKWRFRAGLRGGKKVNTRMRVPITFKLLEAGEI
jgi:TonB family protein